MKIVRLKVLCQTDTQTGVHGDSMTESAADYQPHHS